MKYKDYIFVAVLTIIMVLSTAYIVKPGPITVVQEAPQERAGSTVQHAQWEFVNGIRMGLNRVQFTESGSTITNSGNSAIAGTLAVTGATDLGAGVTIDTESVTADTTLTSASGNVVFLAASASDDTITLPAVAAGLQYEFLVTGALTGTTTIKSTEGDNIEGILMVNDADVACSGEDQINIITDGEVVGDRVELISDGTSWYILDSDADASGKMTCTDPS